MMGVAALWLFCLRTQIDTKAADDSRTNWIEREKREYEEQYGNLNYHLLKKDNYKNLEQTMKKNIELQELRKKKNKNNGYENKDDLNRLASTSNVEHEDIDDL